MTGLSRLGNPANVTLTKHPRAGKAIMNPDRHVETTVMRQRGLRTCRKLVVAVACAALAACQPSAPSLGPRASTTASATSAAAGGTPQTASPIPLRARLYQAATKPCDLVDRQFLTRVFGPDSDDAPQLTRNRTVTAMAGNRSYGQTAGDSTVVTVRVELADPAAIEAQYQGLRSV